MLFEQAEVDRQLMRCGEYQPGDMVVARTNMKTKEWPYNAVCQVTGVFVHGDHLNATLYAVHSAGKQLAFYHDELISVQVK